MIDIRREGSKLVVLVDHGLVPSDGRLKLEWDAGSELLAEALVVCVSDHLAAAIKRVRQAEYESGYRDHTKRLKRRDYFQRTLEDLPQVWRERRGLS